MVHYCFTRIIYVHTSDNMADFLLVIYILDYDIVEMDGNG